MRTFSGAEQFDALKKTVIDSYQKLFPVSKDEKGHSLHLNKIWVDDSALDPKDYVSQKKSRLAGNTWGAPVYAAIDLKDETGKVIDHMEKVRLATIPRLTPRGSYIVGGNEYQVANQLRKKRGVYVVRRATGDQFKADLNLGGDFSKRLEIHFDPLSNKYSTKINQSFLPLYPLLHALGVQDETLKKTWGKEIFEANHANLARELPKYADRLAKVKTTSPDEAIKAIKDFAGKMVVDPSITKLTLGKEYTNLHPELVLNASKKLVDVYQGKQEADDPENLLFKEVLSVEDMLHDAMTGKKQSAAMKYMLSRHLGKRTKIKDIIDFRKISAPVESFFTRDDRSSTPEQYNPIHMLSEMHKLTLMGTGGIRDPHTVTPEIREVHPSHIGFIDPVHTPECFDEASQVYTSDGWKFWKDVTDADLFACQIDGKLDFRAAEKLHKSHYSGPMYGVENSKLSYLVTPNHRMYVRSLDSAPNSWRFELAEESHEKPRTFCTTHEPLRGDNDWTTFRLPRVTGGNALVQFDEIDIGDWCEFIGWFVSEGCSAYDEEKSNYLVRIAQSKSANPEKCLRIEALLNALPWKWCKTGDTGYALATKQLASYLKEQGYCDTKYIPRELQNAPIRARQRLYEALLLGDGRVDSTRKTGVHYKQQVFCTTSPQLAFDFEMLAIGLGHSVRTRVYEDNREERYLPVHEVRVLQRSIRSARKYNRRSKKSDYVKTSYDGTVYCATVPGGLLLVRRNESVPVWLGNSEKIGVVLHLTTGAVKDGRDVRTPVINTKTGKQELLTPRELYQKTVAFPDEADHKDGKMKFKNASSVRVQRLGKLNTVKSSEVEYILPSHTTMFSYSTNLVPFLQNDQGNRVMMASKMLGQAIPLVEREAPHVQTDIGNGTTFHQAIGKEFSVHSPVDGKVTKITGDHIEIGGTKIPLYNDFPLNQKTYFHHETTVKVGDTVKKGQLLADSNFTKGGTLAVGKNLLVAYVPYPGLTFEDGIVITESASKKLASQHIYKHSFEVDQGKRVTDKKKFEAYYPTLIHKDQRSSFDEDGVIRKGSLVSPGQLVIMGLRYELASPENLTLKRINKALQKPWANASVRYTGEFPGTVTDVIKRSDRVDVYVKSTEPAKESDKLAGVHGNKGVITKVIADTDAPHLADGTVPDVLLNPHGIIGRINLGQIYESSAGKISHKTGKPYIVKNFSGDDVGKTVQADLDKHKIDDMEEMFLPNGKAMGKVHIGRPYILRLAKTGKSGFSARMPGSGYDLNLQPTKGGEEGSKAMDLMTFFSMLSHGAKKNLVDAHQKSEKNDEYWHAIETGKPIPAPKNTFAFNKFISLLHGAGINTVKQGQDIILAPLSDGAVKRLSRGEIKEPEFLYGKDLKEKKGGFFDPILTGGRQGTHYTHIELHEALPNPVFEKAIRSLTNMKPVDYDAVIAGTKYLTPEGKLSDEAGAKNVTGGKAIQKLLSGIDVEKEIADFQKKMKAATSVSERDLLNKKMRYLTALKSLNLKPDEAYIRKTVPVIPPMYRPVYEMPNRGLQVSPVNLLYQNVGILTKSHQYPVMDLLDDSEKKDLRTDTYRATRALSGLEPVETRGKAQPIEGFISQITSATPKRGFFLNKIINKRQDLVGRGVITSAPDLTVDELGIPEKMAWNIFRPFIVREYTLAGITPDVAKKELDEKAPRAKQMMLNAMSKRTVLMNRAPSLHKFSIMAFKPRLSDGLAVRVPPLVLKGFGGDFDGDAVTIHVPSSEEAVHESRKMFPSNNLFKPGTGELMIMPSQESAIGLYFLSQSAKGREQINELLPRRYQISGPMDAKLAKNLYNSLARDIPDGYHKIVFDLKQLGDKLAYEKGFSIGMKDLVADTSGKKKVFDKADVEVARLKKTGKPGIELDQKISNVYSDAAKEAYAGIKEDLKKRGNNFYHMVTSGARGKDSQLMQLISGPGAVTGTKDRPVPIPLKRSYAEGLATSDYFVSSYGVRKGMMDRSLQTSAPGALNKTLMASTLDNIITEHDCGVKKGLSLPVDSHDVYDRYLAHDQNGLSRNTLVTPQIIARFKKTGHKEMVVRTPLKCLAKKGTCAYCYGMDEHGELPAIGENIGAKNGQAMSEPMTQMTMKTFHTGGVAGDTPLAKGFDRIEQLLLMPGYVAGEAALAKQSGKITHIQKTDTGAYHLKVGDELHVIPPNRTLKVKVGDSVQAGDVLSTGVIKPQNLLKYKSMTAAQNYLVDELLSAYHSQGVPMQRRVFETVIRSVGNLTRIEKPSKHSDFKQGEVAPFTLVEHHNETRLEHLPVADTAGYHLNKAVGKYPRFHEITEKDIPHLKEMGYNSLDVLKEPIIHTPILRGVEQLPLEKKNWMAQLGYRYIKNTLTDGAAEAWKTRLADTHPIPAFAFGATFGQKKEHY